MKNELKGFWFRTKNKLDDWRSNDPIMITPYLSYANLHEVIIRGRVLENEGIVVLEEDGKWKNFLNSVKRMESDEIKDAHVTVQYQDTIYETRSDDEGYFTFQFPRKDASANQAALFWDSAKIWLNNHRNEGDLVVEAEVKILMPCAQSEYAIISDVDDTILQSNVNSFLKLKLLYTTFLKNIHDRKAFENIGQVLTSLSKNKKNEMVNPIFFVSHSPWNLYPLLEQFKQKSNIPPGPFFLRDFGFKKGKKRQVYKNHKLNTIEHLFLFYPKMKFILLGDATEHDVDIYTESFLKFPGRVLKIIIRATKKEEKNGHVLKVKAQHPNIPIHLIEHSDEILHIVD